MFHTTNRALNVEISHCEACSTFGRGVNNRARLYRAIAEPDPTAIPKVPFASATVQIRTDAAAATPGHVECVARRRPATPDHALAVRETAVSIERDHSDYGGDLPAIQRPQLYFEGAGVVRKYSLTFWLAIAFLKHHM